MPRYSLRTLIVATLLLPPLCAGYWEFLLTQNYGIEGRRVHRERVQEAKARGERPPVQSIDPLAAIVLTFFNFLPVAVVFLIGWQLWRWVSLPRSSVDSQSDANSVAWTRTDYVTIAIFAGIGFGLIALLVGMPAVR